MDTQLMEQNMGALHSINKTQVDTESKDQVLEFVSIPPISIEFYTIVMPEFPSTATAAVIMAIVIGSTMALYRRRITR